MSSSAQNIKACVIGGPGSLGSHVCKRSGNLARLGNTRLRRLSRSRCRMSDHYKRLHKYCSVECGLVHCRIASPHRIRGANFFPSSHATINIIFPKIAIAHKKDIGMALNYGSRYKEYGFRDACKYFGMLRCRKSLFMSTANGKYEQSRKSSALVLPMQKRGVLLTSARWSHSNRPKGTIRMKHTVRYMQNHQSVSSTDSRATYSECTPNAHPKVW